MTQLDQILSDNKIPEIRIALKKHGYYFVDTIYDLEFCNSVIDFIDNYDPLSCDHKFKPSEINFGGSEMRIWSSEHKNPLLRAFYNECNRTISKIVGKERSATTLLAIKNIPLTSDDKSLYLGRWHIDSLLRQFKIFLFLTDTSEASGPFEFIPGTHKDFFKFKKTISGTYIRPLDILGENRKYQRLSDKFIENLMKQGYASKPAICKAGTILIVDTTAIHRARPCIKDSRYALTTYF